MRLVRQLLLSSFFFICITINAQTSENPWAIAVGVDLINLQGDNVESGLNFGAPALSLSRYITSGLSVGIQYGLGSASPQDNIDLDYSYLDGVLSLISVKKILFHIYLQVMVLVDLLMEMKKKVLFLRARLEEQLLEG